MANIADHADDLTPGIVGIGTNALADRRRRRPPVFAREVLADQHDRALLAEIGPLVLATGGQRGAQHTECARRRPDEAAQRRGGVRSVCSVPGFVNPGCTRRIDSKVRIIRREPMRSTTASATCTMVSVLRVMLRSRPALAWRPPARSASARWTRRRFSTGIAPNARPAATESTSVNATDVASTAIISSLGSRAGMVLRTSFRAAKARPRPTA